MSVGFKACNGAATSTYDGILLAAVTLYILAFIASAYRIEPPKDSRRRSTCASVRSAPALLHAHRHSVDRAAGAAQSLVPQAPVQSPHFGVLTFFVALAHAWFMIEWYEAQGTLPNLLAELTTWRDYAKFIGFPFKVIGLAALLLLFLLAATSHDFCFFLFAAALEVAAHDDLCRLRLVVQHVRARHHAIRSQSNDPAEACHGFAA